MQASRILTPCPSADLTRRTHANTIRFSRFHGQQKDIDHSSDVILTTYATVAADYHRGRHQGSNVLTKTEWYRVVLDEGNEFLVPRSKLPQSLNSHSSRHSLFEYEAIQSGLRSRGFYPLVSFWNTDPEPA